VLSQSTWT